MFFLAFETLTLILIKQRGLTRNFLKVTFQICTRFVQVKIKIVLMSTYNTRFNNNFNAKGHDFLKQE